MRVLSYLIKISLIFTWLLATDGIVRSQSGNMSDITGPNPGEIIDISEPPETPEAPVADNPETPAAPAAPAADNPEAPETPEAPVADNPEASEAPEAPVADNPEAQKRQRLR